MNNYPLSTILLKGMRTGKNSCLFYLLFWALLLCFQPVSAQRGGISISGKITGSDDGQSIPGANIGIDRKGIGTAANVSGAYILMIPAANLKDTLKVSCIGYKTKQIPITSLKNGQVLNIVLAKNSTDLKEVKIAYYDPQKILAKAIASIPQNYISHPHILRGFYRMYTFSDTSPLQLSEAVFDVYNYGYGDAHADQFKLIKARNAKNGRDLNDVEIGQKPNSIFEEDVINHRAASGFLSDAGMKNHDFEVHGIDDYEGYQAYNVVFKGKKGVDDATFEGRIYIDTKTYAFLYFDFGLSPNGAADANYGNFASRTLISVGDARIGLKQDHTIVRYQEVGHKFALASVTGDHIFDVKRDDPKNNLTAHMKFNYQVTAVDTVAKSTFETKMGRNESINNYESNSDPSFWKDYNILLSDYNAEDIFKQIKAIPKTK